MPIKIRPPQKKEILMQKVKNRYDHLKAWMRMRRGPVLCILFVFLIVNGSMAAFLWFVRHSDAKAWALASEASALLDDSAREEKEKEEAKRIERFTEAAKKYETVLEKYSSRKVAPIALYQLGYIYFELEKYDLAEAKYLTLIEQGRSPQLLPLAHLKLGYLYKKKKDIPAALNHWRMAYDPTNGEKGALIQDQAGFELAKVLEQTEKKLEAVEIYKKVSMTFSESPWGMEAKARLTLLGEDGASSTDVASSTQVSHPPEPPPLEGTSSVPTSTMPVSPTAQ